MKINTNTDVKGKTITIIETKEHKLTPYQMEWLQKIDDALCGYTLNFEERENQRIQNVFDILEELKLIEQDLSFDYTYQTTLFGKQVIDNLKEIKNENE